MFMISWDNFISAGLYGYYTPDILHHVQKPIKLKAGEVSLDSAWYVLFTALINHLKNDDQH